MIKQLQIGFKLLKYSHGVIINTVSIAAMLVIGIWLEAMPITILGRGFILRSIGGYCILMTGMFVLQMLVSLNVPDIVAVSPWKKRIQTSVFSITAGVCFTVSFLLLLAVKMVKYSYGLVDYTNLVTELLGIPPLILLLIVYMAFSLKYFVASTFVFCIVMPAVSSLYELGVNWNWFSVDGITVGMAVAVCLLTILISVVLAYGILCLIYKKPVSKYSQMNGLKKKM